MVELKRADFLLWKRDETTRQVFEILRSVRQAASDELANGGALSSTADETLRKTATLVGVMHGIDNLLDMEVEDD